MRVHTAGSFALGSVLLFPAGPLPAQENAAQEDPKVARAIEDLGSEQPAVRAHARTAILQAGKPALDALRRAIDAPTREMFAEQLFVIAEDLGRERRCVRFELSKDLGYKSWHIAWLPGGERLAILQDYGGTVQILDSELKPTGDHFGDKTAYFAIDPQDRSLAYNHGDGEVVIVERKTGRRVSIPVRNQPMVAYSPDGRLVVTSGYGNDVEMWSVADGASARRFHVGGDQGGLTPVFSPNGKLLVIGNRNDKTTIFDFESGNELHVLDRTMTQQPAFSPDGTLLAIGYVDGKVGIWNVETGTLEKLLDGEGKEVFAVAWSPDGRILASAGLSGPIVIWSRQHLARLHSLDPGSERTFSLAFRPDGRLLVAAGNGTTRAWTIESTH
jgi:WD40 repeat protein